MANTIKPVPKDYHTVTPCLSLKNSLDAIEFYKKAFGAEELGIYPSLDGKSTMHAAIKIGNSIIMMGDENPEQNCKSAETLGASPVSLYVYVENSDSLFQQALDAGAEVVMPMGDMFWGDRCGSLKDPFGYTWTIATHTRDLSEIQMNDEAEAFFAVSAE